jgi:hypothetical protein
MAKDARNTVEASKVEAPAAATSPNGDDIQPAEAPGNWIEIVQDRLVYKPELCKDYPVRGLILARLDMPAGDNGNPWSAYVIKLTAPTKAVDREGKVHIAKNGNEVLLPATARLDDPRFIAAASNPDATVEIWIKPTHQESLGGGRKMWHYAFKVNPKPYARTADMKILNAMAAPKQLQGGPPAGAETDPWDQAQQQ